MKRLIIIVFFTALAITAYAAPKDGAAILKAVDEKLMPTSYAAYRKLINIEPSGARKEFVLFSVKKGTDKVASVFLSPASEKGRSTLRLGDNMWLYIPEVMRPIRITSLQSVTGGIFNNADILRIDYSAEYSVASVTEQGKNTVLELTAKHGAVAYARLTMTVETKTLHPVQIDCLTEGGMLIKSLKFSDIKSFGDGIVRPAVIETDSPLHKGYKSVMIWGEITKKELSDEVFTESYMSKIESLR